MRIIIKMILSIVTVVVLASCASTGAPIAEYQSPQKALLVLDMQKDFLSVDARMPIEESSKVLLIDAMNRVTALAVQKKILVIYIRNQFPSSDIANLFRNNAAVKGMPGSEIDPRISLVSDLVFDKDQPDAFTNPKLEEYLVSHQVNELTITGVFADQCCYFTSLGALNRKYKVNYLTDVVGAASKENILSASNSLRDKGAIVSTSENWNM